MEMDDEFEKGALRGSLTVSLLLQQEISQRMGSSGREDLEGSTKDS